jgi:hypothetical protein
VDGSNEKPADVLHDLPDAARRSVADFLSVSARSTCDSASLAKALRDSLALSTLHATRERGRHEKGAGLLASPLN